MLAHLGHVPSVTERLPVERVVRIRLQLEAFDERIAAGEVLTAHDGKVYSALLNNIRLCCKEIGLKPASAQPVDPMEAIRGRLAAKRGRAA